MRNEVFQAVLFLILVFVLVFGGIYIELQMFGGDYRCLFVKCVIVK